LTVESIDCANHALHVCLARLQPTGDTKATAEATGTGDVVKADIETRTSENFAFSRAGSIAFDKPGGAKGVKADTKTDACTNCKRTGTDCTAEYIYSRTPQAV
jgi:hypothetical protein